MTKTLWRLRLFLDKLGLNSSLGEAYSTDYAAYVKWLLDRDDA